MKKKVYKSRTNQSAAILVLSAAAVAVAAKYGVDLNSIAATVGLTLPDAMFALTAAAGSAIIYFRQQAGVAPKDEQDATSPRPK
jgi:hypothetical protein